MKKFTVITLSAMFCGLVVLSACGGGAARVRLQVAMRLWAVCRDICRGGCQEKSIGRKLA